MDDLSPAYAEKHHVQVLAAHISPGVPRQLVVAPVPNTMRVTGARIKSMPVLRQWLAANAEYLRHAKQHFNGQTPVGIQVTCHAYKNDAPGGPIKGEPVYTFVWGTKQDQSDEEIVKLDILHNGHTYAWQPPQDEEHTFIGVLAKSPFAGQTA